MTTPLYPPPRVQTLLDEASLHTAQMVVDTDGWSDASRIALAEVAQGLERLESTGTKREGDTAYLARFRRSMFTLLRDLHSRGMIEAA